MCRICICSNYCIKKVSSTNTLMVRKIMPITKLHSLLCVRSHWAPKCWLFIHAAVCKYFTVFIALDVWNCLGITEQFRCWIKEGQAGFFCDLASPTSISQVQTGFLQPFFFLWVQKVAKNPSSEVLLGCSLCLFDLLK